MKPLCASLCLCSLLAATVTAAAADTTNAQALLNAVIARLPQDRLEIQGDLTARKLRGVVVRDLRFDMVLDWGAQPARACYTLRDAFGADLEQLTLVRSRDGQLDTHYASGSPLVTKPTPPLTTRIQGTDISWTDLTLDFLWWRGARVVGSDTVRGRLCDILEVPAPADAAAATGTAAAGSDQYAFVRIWVDRELSLLMQAEAYNAAGTRVRRLWVQSLKKQGTRWMIKDLEVQAYPPVQRTRLRVRDVTALAPR